jgi:hypothetical protein
MTTRMSTSQSNTWSSEGLEAACNRSAQVAEWQRAVKAIRWWETAAEEAVERAAHVEALRLFLKVTLPHPALHPSMRRFLGLRVTQEHAPSAVRSSPQAAAIADILDDYFRKHQKVSMWMMAAPAPAAGLVRADGTPPPPNTPRMERVRRLYWERRAAQLCLTLGDRNGAIAHALEVRRRASAQAPQPPKNCAENLWIDLIEGQAEDCHACGRCLAMLPRRPATPIPTRACLRPSNETQV